MQTSIAAFAQDNAAGLDLDRPLRSRRARRGRADARARLLQPAAALVPTRWRCRPTHLYVAAAAGKYPCDRSALRRPARDPGLRPRDARRRRQRPAARRARIATSCTRCRSTSRRRRRRSRSPATCCCCAANADDGLAVISLANPLRPSVIRIVKGIGDAQRRVRVRSRRSVAGDRRRAARRAHGAARTWCSTSRAAFAAASVVRETRGGISAAVAASSMLAFSDGACSTSACTTSSARRASRLLGHVRSARLRRRAGTTRCMSRRRWPARPAGGDSRRSRPSTTRAARSRSACSTRSSFSCGFEEPVRTQSSPTTASRRCCTNQRVLLVDMLTLDLVISTPADGRERRADQRAAAAALQPADQPGSDGCHDLAAYVRVKRDDGTAAGVTLSSRSRSRGRSPTRCCIRRRPAARAQHALPHRAPRRELASRRTRGCSTTSIRVRDRGRAAAPAPRIVAIDAARGRRGGRRGRGRGRACRQRRRSRWPASPAAIAHSDLGDGNGALHARRARGDVRSRPRSWWPTTNRAHDAPHRRDRVRAAAAPDLGQPDAGFEQRRHAGHASPARASGPAPVACTCCSAASRCRQSDVRVLDSNRRCEVLRRRAASAACRSRSSLDSGQSSDARRGVRVPAADPGEHRRRRRAHLRHGARPDRDVHGHRCGWRGRRDLQHRRVDVHGRSDPPAQPGRRCARTSIATATASTTASWRRSTSARRCSASTRTSSAASTAWSRPPTRGELVIVAFDPRTSRSRA